MRAKIDRSTLGVIAISYNEEKDLTGFLDNLLSWVDEIVIVDDGSTDNTKKIAEDAGEKVKFIVSPRKSGEFYAHQRNKGIDAAQSDWLLHMDIDERVPKKLADEILQEIMKENGKDAYRYRRLNYFLHRPMMGGGWSDWNLVHLAKKDVLRFGGMFHESLKLSCDEEHIGQLHNKIWHLNDESYTERLRKSNNYITEISERIRLRGKKVSGIIVFVAFVKEFMKKYFVKKGFLDGFLGIIWALHAASAYCRAHVIVWDEQHKIQRSKLEEEIKEQYKSIF